VKTVNKEEDVSTVTISLGSGIRYANIEDLQSTEESTPKVGSWRVTFNTLITKANNPEVAPQLFKVAILTGVLACAFALAGMLSLI
jgi:hypothetical protein